MNKLKKGSRLQYVKTNWQLYSSIMQFIDTTEAIKAEEALKGGDTL